MKSVQYYFWLLILVFHIGCSTYVIHAHYSNTNELENIRTGMAIEEVKFLLGEPYQITHLFTSNNDEDLIVHLYSFKSNVDAFNKWDLEDIITPQELQSKFYHKVVRYFKPNTDDHIYTLKFVYQNGILLKYEPKATIH